MASRATQTNTGIDPQIAELLGLDFTADLDREDYISLLKERVMAGRMSSSKLSSEETELITDEFKRVKRDTRKTFKVKKTKITSDTFKKKTSSIRAGSNQKSLPGTGRGGALTVRKTKIDPGALVKSGGEEKEQSILEKILASVNSILGTLREDQKSKKKIADQERRTSERKKRIGKENKLESGIFKGLKKAVDKVLAPFTSLFDRILKFIGTILIGKVLKKVVTWMSDPENEGKLEAIGNFLKVTWPAILGAFLIFSTGLGGVIVGLIALVGKFLPRIAKTIARLAASNPLAAAALAGAGLFAAGAIIPKVLPGTVDAEENKTEAAPGTNEEKIAKLKEQKENLNLLQKMQGVGSEIDEQIYRLETGETKGYSGGGMARGTDTVPAMLTPGEFVMSRGAVQEYGVDTLSSMNAMGGGTNLPRRLSGITYAAGGGMIDKKETLSSSEESKMKQRRNRRGRLVASSVVGRDDKEKKKSGDAHGYGAILDLIGKRESDSVGGFNAVNQIGTAGGHGVDGYSGDYRKAPFNKSGKDLTSMSIAEIMKLQHDDGNMSNEEWKKSGKLHAVGRYQIIGSTLKGLIDQGVARPGDTFNEATQNKLAAALVKQTRGSVDALKSTWIGLQHESDSAVAEAMAKGGNKTTGGFALGSGSVASAPGSSGGSSEGGSTATKKKGALGRIMDLYGLDMDALAKGSSKNKSATDRLSALTGQNIASLGSKPSPSAPPAPPTKAAPKVSIVNSGGSSGQQTPISEAASKVTSVPSVLDDPNKMAVLGIKRS